MANQEQIETLRESLDVLIEEQDFARAAELLYGFHPADQADLIEEQDEEHARALVLALMPDQLGEVLEYLNEELRTELIQDLPAETLA
ncbi:magnesium transporter, partial [Burkholderia multivorans]